MDFVFLTQSDALSVIKVSKTFTFIYLSCKIQYLHQPVVFFFREAPFCSDFCYVNSALADFSPLGQGFLILVLRPLNVRASEGFLKLCKTRLYVCTCLGRRKSQNQHLHGEKIHTFQYMLPSSNLQLIPLPLHLHLLKKLKTIGR